MGIKSKLNKCKEIVSEHGLWYLIKKIGRFIRYKFKQLVNKSAFIYGKNYKRYTKQIKEILKEENYDAVVVFDSRVGWNIPLFQRSQHMANELTDKGFLYFYRTSEQFDPHIKDIEKLKDRLFLTNMSDYALQN
ncbi:MAG: glycosyltransferase, partial [Sarcina sp.]